MTITNHIRKIQEHAESVIEHVDARNYRNAHLSLDAIAANVSSARDHIDDLQLKSDCAARPAGEG